MKRSPTLGPYDKRWKLSSARLATILNAVAVGQTREVAAAMAGATKNTLFNWNRRGHKIIAEHGEDAYMLAIAEYIEENTPNRNLPFDPANPYWAAGARHFHLIVDDWLQAAFSVLLAKADALSEATAVSEVRKAGKKNWQAAAWYLERRHPDTYARRNVVVHEGAEDAPVRMEVTGQSQDIMEKVLRLAGLEEAPEQSEDDAD